MNQSIRIFFSLAIATISLLLPSSPAQHAVAQLPEYVLPAGFAMNIIASGLDRPTAIASLPDGTLLIAEQSGFVKRLERGTSKTETLLNLSDEVNGLFERGLTGMAIDPQFAVNGFLYLLYTYDKPGEIPDGDGLRTGRISRFTIHNGVADSNNRTIILDGFESNVPFHAPGTLRFGSDGFLYASFGDSSDPYQPSDGALRSQDLNQLHGKIVRIQSNGSAVTSNPFYDATHPDSVRSKVFAYGFRNPFRFRAHPKTNQLYIGNVGWQTIESLVRVQGGENFGWPCFESSRAIPEYQTKMQCTGVMPSQLTKAQYDYYHNGGSASIVAGDFAGEGFPSEMHGDFFFGDYSQKWIKRAVLNDDGSVARVLDFGVGVGFSVDMMFGPDGALFFIDYLNGAVKRISYEPTLHAPIAQLAASISTRTIFSNTTMSGNAPLRVTFSAAGSKDVDDGALRFIWNFDAAENAANTNARTLQTTTTPTITHIYEAPGEYIAHVTVLDETKWSDDAEMRIKVLATKPLPHIEAPHNGDTYLTGSPVTLRGSALGIDGRALPAQSLTWEVLQYNSWWHRRTLATGTGAEFSFIMPAAAPSDSPERLEEETTIVVILSAHDAAEHIGETRIMLHPQPRDGYIRTWWLIGEFPNNNLTNDALPGGEALYRKSAGDDNAILIRSASRKIDFAQYIQPAESTMAYAFIWIDSPSEREALLGMTSDDGIAVWLNGQEVWRNAQARYVPDNTRDLDLPKVQMHAGENALLVKVDQKFGEWAFKLRVLNANGSVMRDVTARAGP